MSSGLQITRLSSADGGFRWNKESTSTRFNRINEWSGSQPPSPFSRWTPTALNRFTYCSMIVWLSDNNKSKRYRFEVKHYVKVAQKLKNRLWERLITFRNSSKLKKGDICWQFDFVTCVDSQQKLRTQQKRSPLASGHNARWTQEGISLCVRPDHASNAKESFWAQ
jgi:hypothetical protein